MTDFKNKLMNEPPPKTANFLINSIISPKGIKEPKVLKEVISLTMKKWIKVRMFVTKMTKKKMLM